MTEESAVCARCMHPRHIDRVCGINSCDCVGHGYEYMPASELREILLDGYPNPEGLMEWVDTQPAPEQPFDIEKALDEFDIARMDRERLFFNASKGDMASVEEFEESNRRLMTARSRIVSAFAEQQRTIEQLQKPPVCNVCTGLPLASGGKCICGGIGTEQAELHGFRVKSYDDDILIAEQAQHIQELLKERDDLILAGALFHDHVLELEQRIQELEAALALVDADCKCLVTQECNRCFTIRQAKEGKQ